jgi:uroporphyrinogen III methyltransferase / synthase
VGLGPGASRGPVVNKARGKVWLVGAGPGDPSLITVRGRDVLRRAEVVLYDALSHPALLDECAPGTEFRNVGKRGGKHSPSQDWISRQLCELALAGKRVVRLKGGDPFLFARGAEEALALASAGIDFEIVPGLPSPVAASAYAGIPLTHRELSSSVTFITGSDRAGKDWSPEAWRRLATATDTICVLMGMARIAAITRAIIEGGRSPSTPAAVIQWAARPEQRLISGKLSNIAELSSAAGLANPALILIGDVIDLGQVLGWYEQRPLFGKRILVPRAAQQARTTADAIRERGAEPVVVPAIEIAPPPDPEPLRRAVRELGRYDVCLFTSTNGVERFFEVLDSERKDARAFGAARIGAIGPKTALALKERGIVADVTAEEYVGEALAQAILALPGVKRVLIARALVARDELPRLLGAAGVQVDVVAAYETKPAGAEQRQLLRERLEQGALDVALFTSSSTVTSVLDLLGPDAAKLLERVTIASIGPITTQTALQRGLKVAVSAQRYTVEGLLDALEGYFASQRA